MDASLVSEDFIGKSRIPLINYYLKSRSFWPSFRWSAMTKLAEVPSLSIGSFQKVLREMIYFPFKVRQNVSEFSKNCGIHCKNCDISGPCNF